MIIYKNVKLHTLISNHLYKDEKHQNKHDLNSMSSILKPTEALLDLGLAMHKFESQKISRKVGPTLAKHAAFRGEAATSRVVSIVTSFLTRPPPDSRAARRRALGRSVRRAWGVSMALGRGGGQILYIYIYIYIYMNMCTYVYLYIM